MLNYHQHICKHGVQGLLLTKTRDGDYEKMTEITVALGLTDTKLIVNSSVISSDILIF